ncbi:epimerase [Tateyamaria omphalii]|uniref:NAD-dependent epimerase/dehydratase family protein n=1 Tax=Tateyamaria omphalii TaxID=299262 RepID=UPI00167A0686|nr:NAD(P)-dependent oxidoreductase [Tateyamaria omphalii]GGX38744.1 epimerase [Tateyamaria omphalii]
MRIVMLGAGGKLGQLLKPRWPGAATWTTRSDVDIADPDALARALSGADAVFCLAGVTHGSNAPMELNTTLARQTLDAAHGAHVFLFSSAAVYGALQGLLSENGATSAQSQYGISKLEMERMAAQHPNPSTSLRLGNVAGADAILGGWQPGFQLDQFPDGSTPVRSYIGPGKLAEVLNTLAHSNDLPQVLNIATPNTVHMGDLLDAAALEWTPRPATDRAIASVHLDTAALERFTSFTDSDSTANGIVADWMQGTHT